MTRHKPWASWTPADPERYVVLIKPAASNPLFYGAVLV